MIHHLVQKPQFNLRIEMLQFCNLVSILDVVNLETDSYEYYSFFLNENYLFESFMEAN